MKSNTLPIPASISLLPVLDAALLQDIPLAVSRAQEISQLLVPDTDCRTDPIWLDGERDVLTIGILAVCLECNGPMCPSMANVRAFLARMLAPMGEQPRPSLMAYLEGLPEGSPLKTAMEISQIEPEKMHGKFYASVLTSALVTLEWFQDPL